MHALVQELDKVVIYNLLSHFAEKADRRQTSKPLTCFPARPPDTLPATYARCRVTLFAPVISEERQPLKPSSSLTATEVALGSICHLVAFLQQENHVSGRYAI